MKNIIIFDLDGVLLNSEKLYLEMNQKFFKELGASISLEEHQTFVGISATKMWSYIKEKFNLPYSVDELKEMEKGLKFKTLEGAELVPSEGVLDFLEVLKANQFTLAIASSGLRKNIELILGKLKAGSYFDLVVSGEEVARGKPEPDIFLKVSSHFRRSPGECFVIEDSTNGVTAAKSAGMTCLAYFNPDSGRQDLTKADFVFDHFEDKRLFEMVGLPIS
jgi:HAD superfamily hydrolase (TIGR01509 family)